MARIPALEYSLSHPHPKGHLFLLATLVIFILTLPVLILVNFVTQGSELVPSLQSHYQPNETLLDGWWGTGRLPTFFRPKPPRCQPKDIGRGDTFRLTSSLFDYTVMSTLNNTQVTGTEVQEQIRPEYKGQNFSGCYVNNHRFEYNLFDKSQSVTVGVLCPGFPEPSVEVSMQTTIKFSWELAKDFIGQYYGPGLDLLNINNTNPSDYRRVVLAVLQVISTDSLTIISKPLLSNPAGSITMNFDVDPTTFVWNDTASTLTYVNGSQPDPYPAEGTIYRNTIANLLTVAVDAVYIDLGSHRLGNVFRNATRFKTRISPNLPPPGINSSDWAEGSQTFHYGRLSGYQTWADTLLHGQPVTVGNLSGLPEESVMATTYLCPSYQVKPIGSLLSSVFIGSATMTLSVWGTWIFFTTFIAKRMMAPRVRCECDDCKRRREKEERQQNTATNQTRDWMFSSLLPFRSREPATEETPDSSRVPNSGSRTPPIQRPTDLLHNKHLSGSSGYTTEEKQDLSHVSHSGV
ncbi:hypothetical protein OPQ81_011852 [Rhizoctonia solani]|nr:hypothetical protein OPQ81_011852 [Rhizoctonia solani]